MMQSRTGVASSGGMTRAATPVVGGSSGNPEGMERGERQRQQCLVTKRRQGEATGEARVLYMAGTATKQAHTCSTSRTVRPSRWLYLSRSSQVRCKIVQQT